ncbi:MAG: autorepressor SdpR family transcription factor [Phycisphaerae bacterium]
MFGFEKSFKAMADPTRRAILGLLRERPMNAGEIAQRLHVASSALSFHLRALREADLVSDERQGQFVRYTLNTSVVEDLIRFLLTNFSAGDARNGVGAAAVETRTEATDPHDAQTGLAETGAGPADANDPAPAGDRRAKPTVNRNVTLGPEEKS